MEAVDDARENHEKKNREFADFCDELKKKYGEDLDIGDPTDRDRYFDMKLNAEIAGYSYNGYKAALADFLDHNFS